MIIKEITLNNFRIYNGENTINLTPSDNKNIIIVSGENGFGKTTFLMSLVWCLYGKQMENVDDLYKKEIRDKRNYGIYIAGSLNKTAELNGKRSLSVSILFGDIDDNVLKCEEIRVTRSYNIRNSSADDLIITFDGEENTEWKYLDKNDKIEQEEFFIREHILPLEIAKFYFFDAEKIVAFADSSEQQREALSKAYAQVLGIQRFDDLKNEIVKVREEYRKSSANSEEQEKFQQICDSIENAGEEITRVSEEIRHYRNLVDEARQESDNLQTKIVREGNYFSDDELEEMKKKENQLKSVMDETKDRLKDLYNYIPFAIGGEMLAEVIEQVNKEKRFKQQNQSFENVEEKTNALLNDLDNERIESGIILDYKIRTFYENKVKELIKRHFFETTNTENFDGFSVLHGMTDQQESSLVNFVSKVKDCRKDFVQLFSQYSNAKAEYNAIQQKIREAESVGESPIHEMLRKQKSSCDENIRRYSEDIGRFISRTEEINENLKKEKQQREILAKKISLSNDVKRYDDELGRLIHILDEYIRAYKKRKLESLQKKIASKLKDFMHKKDLIKDVEIYAIGNEIVINLIDMQNKAIDQNSLSMGERQLFSSAILGSLVEETDYDFPVFIDSPLQKLDISHSSNILQKFYPTVSKQVVMFPLLYKELTEMEYELINPKVSKVFKINHNNEGSFFTSLKNIDDLFKK